MNIPNTLIIDIETIPCVESFFDLDSRTRDCFVSKMNSTYPNFEDLPDAERESIWVKHSSIMAEFCKIAAVSMIMDSTNSKLDLYIGQHGIQTEEDLLFKVRGVMNNAFNNGVSLAGFGIDGFDIPVIFKRSIVNGIQPSPLIMYWDKKPWEIKTYDLQKMWSNGAWSNNSVSLDTVCMALGITGKIGMSGADVASYWYNGKEAEVSKYCNLDVQMVSDCFFKLRNLKEAPQFA